MEKLKRLLQIKSVRTILVALGIAILTAELFFISLWIGLTFDLPFYNNLPADPVQAGTVASLTTSDPVTDDTREPDTTPQDSTQGDVADVPTDTDDITTVPDVTTTDPEIVNPPETDAPIVEKPRPVYPVTDRKLVICVDPGHGYHDPGTSSKYLGKTVEKDINLKAGLLVAQKLRDAGFEVIMTHSDDVIPDKYESVDGLYRMNPYAREDFVRAQEVVDIFVSIHCNAIEGKDAEQFSGTELYYYLNNNELTPGYAESLRAAILEATGRNSRVAGLDYDNAYYVNKAFPVPSVLVEMGYVTNPEDATLLKDDAFIDSMTTGIANGITNYCRRVMQP